MSRNQRIGLLVAAAVVAVVAIVVAVASGGGGDNGDQAAQTNTTTQEQTGTTGGGGTPTETTAPAEPAVNRIRIQDGKVVGGPADIQVKKGDQVTIVVSANAPDDVHLHGYDIEKPVEPGKPATFKFTADIEGIFEIESHKAEDEGRDPLLGKLTVEPS
jgi:plastocyanin